QTRKISNSLIRQSIHFYAQSRRIDFETYVDWKAEGLQGVSAVGCIDRSHGRALPEADH
ncbi:MAG: hypothetical protein HFH29_09255, partial [Eubacterium sp.]|nr:hypothetical protein [Eubacterium sp.]